MSTSEHTETTIRVASQSTDESLVPEIGPECFRCGSILDYVGTGKGDRSRSSTYATNGKAGRQTVYEHVRCPDCDAAGTFVKLSRNDRVVRRLGPATRAMHGRSRAAREQAMEHAPTATPAPSSEPRLVADGGWGWSE